MALGFFPLVTRLLKQWPLKETDLEEPTSCKSKEVPSTAEHVLLLQSKEFDNSPSVGNKKILQITIQLCNTVTSFRQLIGIIVTGNDPKTHNHAVCCEWIAENTSSRYAGRTQSEALASRCRPLRRRLHPRHLAFERRLLVRPGARRLFSPRPDQHR